MIEAIDALVAGAYMAALDSDQWPALMAGLAGRFHGVYATLCVLDHTTGDLLAHHDNGVPEGSWRRYAADFMRRDPRRLHAARTPPGTVVRDGDFITEAEMDRHPYYAEFLAAEKIRYFIGTHLPLGPRTTLMVRVQRTPRQGAAPDAQVPLLAALAPHLGQAAQIASRLESERAERRALATLAENLAYAVLVLDRDAHVVHMNPAAEALTAACDGFSVVRDGFVSLADSAARARLARAVARAAGSAVAPVTGDSFLCHRPSGAAPYEATVTPLPREGAGFAPPLALLVVADPGARAPEGGARRLAALYGLSPGEARLAVALAGGRTLDEAAADFGVRPASVRTQLRRAMGKTGTHRQAELIALVLKGLGGLR